VLKTPSLKNRLMAAIIKYLETKCMQSADHVVVISQGLFDEIVSRGVRPEMVTIIPNAVNLTRITNQTISVLNNPAKNWKFAYIGSLSEIEGLDLLIEAIHILRNRNWNNQLHIYGDGPAMLKLKEQAKTVDGVIFHGAFKQDQIQSVYDNVDVVVNPRKQSRLTDAVTPLKPLEAMAWRKLVIASSVKGMKELVKHLETGIIFDISQIQNLVTSILYATENPKEMSLIVDRGHKYVKSSRTWLTNAKTYDKVYRALADG